MLAVACSSQSVANKADSNYTDQQYAIYSRGQPNDLFDYSQDRASFQAIYRARVQGKATWSASIPTQGGHPWFECPSKGYPIPASSQLTNPERPSPAFDGSSSAFVTLPQGEPNGLFSGPTDGTYMQCIDTDGSLAPVYSEPQVLAWPYPVVWKGDHFEKANPNDRASYTVPDAPPAAGQPKPFVPTTTTPTSR
jgi:hypothetical protein